MFTFRLPSTLPRCGGALALLLLLLLPHVTMAVSDRDAVASLESTQAAFRLIHNKVSPAVVSITSRVEETSRSNDPFDLLFGTPRGPRISSASGSGVIIRSEGIVLTNSHVVENATKVTVTLAGTEKPLPAEVVQADPRTDLAVVRITEKGKYPVAVLGDASKVQVGDWAIAFGSPFRLASTMTLGVVSATGRELSGPDDEFTYRDLLQTDASINPGNSGGPLANINGEVVGINFMIFSPGSTSGSVGIGFAIPINDYTRSIVDTLAAGRTVERGMLGVIIKNLDDAMREQYGVADGGVFVDHVAAGQAAEKGGIKDEDVIVAFNGVKVTDSDQFVKLVERTKPGTKVPVVVIRGKREQALTITVGAVGVQAKADVDERKTGMSVITITPVLADQLRLPDIAGVLVTQVYPGSPAADAGMKRGDIVLRVGGNEVKTKEEFWRALADSLGGSKHGVLLRIRRGDQATTVTLQLDRITPGN